MATAHDPDLQTNTVISTPIKSTGPAAPPSDKATEHIVEEITTRFVKAQRPVIIVDACCGRFGMAGEVRKLVETCGIRFFDTPSKLTHS